MKTNKDRKQTEFEKYIRDLVSEKGISPFRWNDKDFNILGDFMDKEKDSPKDSFKTLSERYGHYFEDVDPVEYVKELRGEVDRNAYTFTGECCDQ